MQKRNLVLVAGAATLAVVFAGGGAVAASLITSADIKDQTIRSVDIHANAVGKSEIRDEAVGYRELTQVARNRIANLASFGLSHLVTDGPYDHGDWVGDSGATLQTAIVKCDPGYFATGGGFSGNGGVSDPDVGDTGTVADAKLQIVASYPYVDPSASINSNGSIRPNEWVVRGFNNGTAPLVVRPWVTCAPGHVG
jgi:hypothetical protein